MIISNIESSSAQLKTYRKGTISIPTDYTLASLETLNIASLPVGGLGNNNSKLFCYIDRTIASGGGLTKRYVSRAGGVTGLTAWYNNGGTPATTTITLFTKIKDGYFLADITNERSFSVTPIEPFIDYQLHYFIFYY